MIPSKETADSPIKSASSQPPLPVRGGKATTPELMFNNEVNSPRPVYSSITGTRLTQLQLLLGISTITSPLTATIYLPLLPLLRIQFNTSAQVINLTLTIYIIFQGISPVIFGPLSDTHGRRPLFLLTLFLYVVGNIGLAVNERSYAVLLLMRAVQSLGASAAYAISFGIVADVCTPSSRGRMLGPISAALNIGTCVGPVVGGVVAYRSGSFHWVFWALVVVGAILLWGVGLFLPETARNLVGNGCDPLMFEWWQLSWYRLIRAKKNKEKGVEAITNHSAATKSVSDSVSRTAATLKESDDVVERKHTGLNLAAPSNLEPNSQVLRGGKPNILRNLFAVFVILLHKHSLLTLWLHGSFYVVDYAFVASLPDIFQQNYEFNELYVGLAYLPRGVGIILGSYVTGKLMDRNYRVTAREIGRSLAEKNKSSSSGEVDDESSLENFPIERARSRGSYLMLVISTSTMIAYGWTVHYRVHFAVLLVLQFAQGFWGTYFYTTYSALLVDSYPKSPSTAAAATSATRCAMAAAGVAVLQPLLDAAGRGWYFTVLGLWSGILGAIAVLLLRAKGMEWRKKQSDV